MNNGRRIGAATYACVVALGCGATPAGTDEAIDGSGQSVARAERMRLHLVAPKITSDGEHACALRGDGAILCWGGNDFGELGDGTTSNRASAAAVALAPARDVSAGLTYTCAVVDRAVVCWGHNSNGQLADGTTGDHALPGPTLFPAAVAVAAAASATCAVGVDGSVWCAGDGAGGSVNPTLGNGAYASSSTPVQTLGITDAIAITGSWYHFCALRASGAIACWGANSGRLGDGTNTIDSNVPVAVLGVRDAVEVSAGINHTCALRANGEVLCWGNNQFGQLGDGTKTTHLTATPTILPRARAVAAGNKDTCVIVHDGTLRCVGWAGGSGGQLGSGSASFSLTPVTPAFLIKLPPFPPFELPLGGVVAVASGGILGTSCASTICGEAFCWGDDDEGEVGDGAAQPAPVLRPARVQGY